MLFTNQLEYHRGKSTTMFKNKMPYFAQAVSYVISWSRLLHPTERLFWQLGGIPFRVFAALARDKYRKVRPLSHLPGRWLSFDGAAYDRHVGRLCGSFQRRHPAGSVLDLCGRVVVAEQKRALQTLPSPTMWEMRLDDVRSERLRKTTTTRTENSPSTSACLFCEPPVLGDAISRG